MSRQPSQSSKPSQSVTKQERRRQRREEQQRQIAAQRRARMRRVVISVIVGLVVIGAIASFAFFVNRNGSGATATQPATTTVPTPGPTSSTGDQASIAPAVDGVQCNSSEQLTYHIHAHLSIYIDGKAVPVAEAIGIKSSCIYWLHTHDTSGVIHIESPTQKTYTLGNFLDLWKQQFAPLQYPTQLDQASGWQVYVNGKSVGGDFRALPLNAHTLITLAYQSPGIKPDSVFNWGDL